MGCDIHATIERKQYDWWLASAKDVDIDRNYSLFTMLADVRNYDRERKPKNVVIALPRGTPEDKSFGHGDLIKEWEGDDHSHSWITFKELKNHKQKFFKSQDFYKFMKVLAKKYGDTKVRLVFFFDN